MIDMSSCWLKGAMLRRGSGSQWMREQKKIEILNDQERILAIKSRLSGDCFNEIALASAVHKPIPDF